MGGSEKLHLALEFAKEKHSGQKRIGGDDYITHPIAVCEIVKKQGFDENYLIAALFHDLLEDTDATEEEIAAARQVVEAAQVAANTARVNANEAAKTAAEAQETASTAVYSANEAQAVANAAANHAKIAQSVAADSTNAAAAQLKADQAAQTATTAQETANTATQAAEDAKAAAKKAADDAAQAIADSEAADAQATQAAADLVEAKQRLADVLADVNSTQTQIEEAQAAVQTAQAFADEAIANATKAAAYAAQAAIEAADAQVAADTAKTVADNAKAAADEAQAAADAAQEAVNALAVRVTTAETQITQNAEQIQLRATKEEITQTLAGYATTAEMEAAISVKADEINLSVDSKINSLPVSGRNLLLNSKRYIFTADYTVGIYYCGTVYPVAGKNYTLQLKGELGSDRTCFRVFSAGGKLCDLIPNGDGTCSATFEWNSTDGTYLQINQIPSTGTSKSTIEWIKLEEGIRATDWSFAPEETEVKVGGRNYILASTAELNSALNGSTVYLDLNYAEALKECQDKEFILSFDAKYESEADELQWGFYFRGGTTAITDRRPVWNGMTTEYTRYAYSVKYLSGKGPQDITQVRFAFTGGTGTVYVKNIKLEIGSKTTAWTPAPEDHADAGNVDQQFQTITESMAQLQVSAEGILGRVSSVEAKTSNLDGLNRTVEQLQKDVSAQITSDAVEYQISQAMQKGTEKVVTSTGYRFDEEGLTVEKSGSEMKTQITDNGMAVFQGEEKVLEANNNGVDAKNLHAVTYLIVGANSRFEDYGNGRTGCFWIGG